MAWIKEHGNRYVVQWGRAKNYGCRSFESQEQAEKFKEEIERKVYRRSVIGRLDKATATSLAAIAEQYVDALNIAPCSRYSYHHSIFRPFLAFFKDESITGLTTLDLQTYFGQRRTQVMASTVARDYSILKKFFRWATSYFLLPQNPMEFIRVRRVHRSPGVCLSYEQMKKILDAVTPYQRCKILLARDCGLRASNVGALLASDIDFERRTLTFHVLKKGEDQLENAETRTLPLTSRLYAALAAFQKLDPSAHLFTYRSRALRDPTNFSSVCALNWASTFAGMICATPSTPVCLKPPTITPSPNGASATPSPIGTRLRRS